MAKFNVDTKVLTLDGTEAEEAYKNEEGKDAKRPATFKKVIIDSLMATEENLAGTEKLKRYGLAKKINIGGEVELNSEQKTLIENCVAKTHPTFVYGALYELLEGEQK
jgi:hypothetical protein